MTSRCNTISRIEYKLRKVKKYTEAIDENIQNIRKDVLFLDTQHRTTELTK